MDGEAAVPSISSGSVGSRFVSQNELDQAKATRDEQWKAAYARLGQEPPPRPQDDADYDGRSLYERLASQKTAKQEKWDEDHKLSKQFRALEEDEILFLDSVMEEQRAEERARRDLDHDEVANFKQAVAAREQMAAGPLSLATQALDPRPLSPVALPSATSAPPIRKSPGPSSNSPAAIKTSVSASSNPKPKATSLVGKKDQKSLLKGVVRKKSASVANARSGILNSPSRIASLLPTSRPTALNAQSPQALISGTASTTKGALAKRQLAVDNTDVLQEPQSIKRSKVQ